MIDNTSPTNTGRNAEQVAAEHLKKQKYTIIQQNWRTRYCEIDIVAQKNGVVFFVEVKYRKNASYGDGLEAITPKKLKQVNFAAQMWLQQNDWAGDYQILAISVSGESPRVEEVIEI
jgi:ribonuclease HII